MVCAVQAKLAEARRKVSEDQATDKKASTVRGKYKGKLAPLADDSSVATDPAVNEEAFAVQAPWSPAGKIAKRCVR